MLSLIPPDALLRADVAGAARRPARNGEVLAALPGGMAAATAAMMAWCSGAGAPWSARPPRDGAGAPAGTRAVTAPASDGAVEIAGATFPGHEGRGIAFAGPRADRAPAHPAPAGGAGTRILRRLGFAHAGRVRHAGDGPARAGERRRGPRP